MIRSQRGGGGSHYWLVKSEPATYSWQKFAREGRAVWDGVRNYQARNNLMKMKKGDRVLFYHSNEGLAVVGIAEVAKEFYPDPTTQDKRWVAVELVPSRPLDRPVTLGEIKSNKFLQEITLVRHGRLSVMPLKAQEFERILRLGSEKG